MRFVVYGAGAIGGVIGARLFEHGHDVVLIARGEHASAIRRSGLRVESPDGTATLSIPVVEQPGEVTLAAGDVVLLAVKSQDTVAALEILAGAAAEDVSVVCAQNGVQNERSALRRFRKICGVLVMLPAMHLEPGVVQASSAPVTGMLDVGRYPSGLDDTAEALVGAFNGSGFDSIALEDIMRWKYRKLIMNLGNAAEALCGDAPETDEVERLAAAEGEACLEAAEIDVASREEDRARRADLLKIRPVGGQPRGGGSTWQSLVRGARTLEVDYLNGEIVLLGRLHGVPTPVNELLQRLANRAARQGRAPGFMPGRELLRVTRGVLSGTEAR